jgi:hypothetical protein
MVAEMMTDERLAWHMENWAEYMRNDRSEIRELGFPAESVGFIQGVTHSEDSAMLAEQEADLKDAHAMDAIIDSLLDIDPYLYSVVYKYHGFRLWTKQPKDTDYPDACAVIKQLAMKRGLV